MKKVYDNKAFFKTIEESLSNNEKVAFIVKGNSMKPFFIDGLTEVFLKKKLNYNKKDICLFKKNDTYFLHRLIKIKQGLYYFRGDNLNQYEIVKPIALIGYVYQYKNNDRIIKTNNFFYKLKLYCFLAYKKLYLILRAIYLGVKSGFSSSKKH
ncbi:MAG: S24/S26 family peptidase [Bacillota bacterium]